MTGKSPELQQYENWGIPTSDGGDRSNDIWTYQNHYTEHDSFFQVSWATKDIWKVLKSPLTSQPVWRVTHHFQDLFFNKFKNPIIFDQAKDYFEDTKNLPWLIYLIKNKSHLTPEEEKNKTENYKDSIRKFITEHKPQEKHPNDVSRDELAIIASLLSQWYDISDTKGNNIALWKDLLKKVQDSNDRNYDNAKVLVQDAADQILAITTQDEEEFLDQCCSILKIR